MITQESDHSIVAEDLARSFGRRTALDGATFNARQGEVLVLLGPNGAGKTTAIRVLNGLLIPERGNAHVGGFDVVKDADSVRRITGVVTEEAALDDRLTALENVAIHARLRGMATDTIEQRSMEALETFDIADRAADRVRGFSTGQRKRVALARAMVHHPDVLLLDEPTSGLDPESTRHVLLLVADLARTHGSTVLLCTHFLGEANAVADRMAVMDAGRVVALGRPEDLVPKDELVVDVELGQDPSPELEAKVAGIAGVQRAERRARSLHAVIEHRGVAPDIVATLVGAGLDVYGVSTTRPTIEEAYFFVRQHEREETENGAA